MPGKRGFIAADRCSYYFLLLRRGCSTPMNHPLFAYPNSKQQHITQDNGSYSFRANSFRKTQEQIPIFNRKQKNKTNGVTLGKNPRKPRNPVKQRKTDIEQGA